MKLLPILLTFGLAAAVPITITIEQENITPNKHYFEGKGDVHALFSRKGQESSRRRKVVNLDFDARVPIPVSVFPSTYRSDATSVETTTETKVEGEVQQGQATQRVGREDTRIRREEDINVKYDSSRYRRGEERPDQFRVVQDTRIEDRRYPEERQTERFAEVDINRENYRRDDRRVNFDVDAREQIDLERDVVYDREAFRDIPAYGNNIDITEREYRRRVQPNYQPEEYERRRPDEVVTEKTTIREDNKAKMGYYDDQGEYHSFRRGVERAADRILHPFSHHDHHDRETIVVNERERERSGGEGVRETVRYVSPRGGSSRHTIPIPCHFIRIGDILILQGRPCQVIRISQSSQTGQYRYLGVDLFSRQLQEESSFVSNPEPSVIVQSMIGPVFKQYRILDIREDSAVVCITEGGDVKQGIPVVNQGGLFGKIERAFREGRGSVRAVVINDGGRELIVDYKVIHGSRL